MTGVDTAAPVRAAVTVRVSPERAWEVFTGELPRWWPVATHSLAAGEGTVPDGLFIEPGEGGEIYEVTGGVRRHWARIHTWEPPRRLGYTWRVNPESPPTDVAVTFSEAGDGTRVEVVHTGWEAYADGGAAARASYGGVEGWPVVLEGFRKLVEPST